MSYTYPYGSNRTVESGYYPVGTITIGEMYRLLTPWSMMTNVMDFLREWEALTPEDQKELKALAYAEFSSRF